MNEQYCIKKNGRYIPAHDPGALEGLYNGAWLVIVKPNSKSIRQALNPKFVELDASLEYLEEELVKAMHKKAEMQPRSTPLSKKEQKAWAQYRKTMGKDMPTMFYYPSLYDIANSGCRRIKEIMLENKMDVEKIKKKYKKREITNAIMDLEV